MTLVAPHAQPAPQPWLARRVSVVRAMLPVFFFGVLPPLLYVWVLRVAVHGDVFAIDFHHALWPAARDVLAGVSPYPAASSHELESGLAFVYPPVAAVAIAPLAVLPHALADAIFTALLLGAAFLTLRLLGVRDWRCYGAMFLWAPVFSAVQTANLTLLLGLGLAAVWRYRDSPIVSALAAALLVAGKPVLWPVFVWLLATRRYRSALTGALVAAVLTLGGWAVIGFAGMTSYLPMLRDLARLEQAVAYTPFAALTDLGVGPAVAHAIGVLLAVSTLAACVYVARKPRGEGVAFVLAVAASLLFSPIVSLHYFALLLVPVALAHRRLSGLWLLPITLWVVPGTGNGVPWQTLLILGIAFAVLLFAARTRVELRASPTVA